MTTICSGYRVSRILNAVLSHALRGSLISLPTLCKGPKFAPFSSISYGFWDSGKFILSNQKTAKPKISKFEILHAVTLLGSKIRSVSLYLLRFLRKQQILINQSENSKSKISKFALSLTVSEIMDNLRFRGHVTLRGHVTSKSKFLKVLILYVVNPQGSKICSVSLYLLRWQR